MTRSIVDWVSEAVGTSSAGNRGVLVLLAGLVVYGLMAVFFYPCHYAPADEGCYISMAFLFASGRLTAETVEDLNVYRFTSVDGRLIGIHGAGLSGLLVPFTDFGDMGPFAFNILLHATGFVFFYLILRRMKVHPVFSLLYLLHPTLWYHSRNVVNDLPSGILLLIGFYFFIREKPSAPAAGIFWGLSLLIRPVTMVFLVPLVLTWFVIATVKARRSTQVDPVYRDARRKVMLLAAGVLPLMALLVTYNLLVPGNVTGYVPRRVIPAGFSIGHVPRNLLRYLITLNLVYPLMLILFFFYHGMQRWPLIVGVLAGSLFYMTYVDWGGGDPTRFGLLESVVLGPRYLEPVVPLMVMTYAWVLQRVARYFKKPFWVLYGVAMLAILAADVGATVVHQRHMKKAAYFRDLLFDHTPRRSLILMAEPARSRISGSILRPRRLVAVFPLVCHPDEALPRLDRLVQRYGEGYVTCFSVAGEMTSPVRTYEDREAFIRRHPHETVLDIEKDGWRLKIIRVTPTPSREGAWPQDRHQVPRASEVRGRL